MMNTLTKTSPSDREILFELRAELRERAEALPKPKTGMMMGALQALIDAENALTLWLECKALDLGFLENVHPTTKLPRFASLDLWAYKRAVGGRARDGNGAFAKQGVKMQKDGCQFLRGELMYRQNQEGVRTPAEELVYIALPPSPVPAAIEAKANTLPGEKFVAWEATWEKAPKIEVKDPILYTVTSRGAFVVGAWDMTKLEAYIASEFTT